MLAGRSRGILGLSWRLGLGLEAGPEVRAEEAGRDGGAAERPRSIRRRGSKLISSDSRREKEEQEQGRMEWKRSREASCPTHSSSGPSPCRPSSPRRRSPKVPEEESKFVVGS